MGEPRALGNVEKGEAALVHAQEGAAHIPFLREMKGASSFRIFNRQQGQDKGVWDEYRDCHKTPY